MGASTVENCNIVFKRYLRIERIRRFFGRVLTIDNEQLTDILLLLFIL